MKFVSNINVSMYVLVCDIKCISYCGCDWKKANQNSIWANKGSTWGWLNKRLLWKDVNLMRISVVAQGTHDGVLIRSPPPDTELLRDKTLCDKLSVSSTWRTCRHEITVCWLNMVTGLQGDSQGASSPGIPTSVYPPPTLYQGWSVWPTEQGASDHHFWD